TDRAAEQAHAEQLSYGSMLRAAKQKVAALAGGPIASKTLGVHTLTAPLEGSVVERHITQGELVTGDTVAFVVAQLDHLWVELDVFERHLDAIAVGDAVTLHALSGTHHEIQGRVAHVGAVVDRTTRSARVRVEVDNRERHLRPGQAVEAKISGSRAAHSGAT